MSPPRADAIGMDSASASHGTGTGGRPVEREARSGDLLRGLFDPAWWFLIAGIGALATAMLIPAAEALSDAVWQRNIVLAGERERAARIERHTAYLAALERGDAGAIAQLRVMQLNEVPEGLEPLGAPRIEPGRSSASVFGMLEPEPAERPTPPAHHAERSRLAAWATGPRSRLWLIGGGCFCVLLGLAPIWTPSRARSQGEAAADDDLPDDDAYEMQDGPATVHA